MFINFSQKVCEKGFFENKNVYHTKYILTSVSRVKQKKKKQRNREHSKRLLLRAEVINQR